LELLRLIVPSDRIDVVPPTSSGEAGFDGLDTWEAIERRLQEIAGTKASQVSRQLTAKQKRESIVIVADTVIVVETAPRGRGSSASGSLYVLGQPPDDNWREIVRTWFVEHYAGRTHLAVTALRVELPSGAVVERLVKTAVTFHDDVESWLDWYLDTGEPRGKAGGYALQGVGSVFVQTVEGSLSNVVGLPIEALLEILHSEAQG
jgi:septum formation protein